MTQDRFDDKPFHILLLGDFSGRANRGLCEPASALAARRPRQVDRDNLDELMDRLDVELTRTVVTGDAEPITIRFHELDDFHPDQLFENVALFSSLRSLRQRLLNQATFSQAADEVLGWGPPTTTAAPSPATESKTGTDSEQNVAELLDRMLAEAESADQRGASPAEIDWNRLIQEIVAPVMPRRIDPRQDELVACVDSATQTLMTALLHHPHFQQLEAAWRGLDFLVRRVETGVALKIFLVDVSKVELAADLSGHQELAGTDLYRLLVEQTLQTPGAVPWSLLCGLYAFGGSSEDVQLLGQLASVAAAAQAPFLSAADGSLVGYHRAATLPAPERWEELDPDVQSQWDASCRLPAAGSAGLLWPRFLLRLPYGAATRPIDTFPLEEMPQGIRHEHLVWGNPVLLAACVIGQSFAAAGWHLRMSQGGEITDLPIITEEADGETVFHPCGELLLTERAAEHARRRGVTPVLSIQGRDAVRLPSLQSIHGTAFGAG